MSATEYVILVDQENSPTGTAEKLVAHRLNLLHRAFSAFILRQKNAQWELLLQQRATHKYHCPNLWSNTCCSHPRHGETVLTAGKRRLYEELGIDCELTDIGWFHYNAHFANGLSENEIDHVLVGIVPEEMAIRMNPNEVRAYQWLSLPDLQQALIGSPNHYTAWLPLALPKVMDYLNGL